MALNPSAAMGAVVPILHSSVLSLRKKCPVESWKRCFPNFCGSVDPGIGMDDGGHGDVLSKSFFKKGLDDQHKKYIQQTLSSS